MLFLTLNEQCQSTEGCRISIRIYLCQGSGACWCDGDVLCSAFFWLLSLLLSAAWWKVVIPLREVLVFGLVFSVIFQELFRFLFYLLLK